MIYGLLYEKVTTIVVIIILIFLVPSVLKIQGVKS